LGVDLRVLFFIMLGVALFLFYLRFGGQPITPANLYEVLLDVLLVPSALMTAGIFLLLFLRVDVRSATLQAIDKISNQTVSFVAAVPPELEKTIKAKFVERQDTDGDGFKEWVVFYEYDLQTGTNPLQVTIYDNDRGNPPVIFPYQLRVPDRDYLSENALGVQISLADVTTDANGPNRQNIPEVLVQDGQQLSIFRYNGRFDTNVWDPPSDSPPRYVAIGAFKGTGGVDIDLESGNKAVTVIDRDKYNRSQLAERVIYALNPVTSTYWDDYDSTRLAAPIMSTVDFFSGPPEDIAQTAYPEKVVLAFYASTCGTTDTTLCRWAGQWKPEQFLVKDDTAWNEYQNPAGGPAYFGLNSFSASRNLQVKDIRYYPALESVNTRDLTTGPQPTTNVVDIKFTVDGGLDEARSCMMLFSNGQWKISECTPSNLVISNSSAPGSINTSTAQ